jgi:hypothetical protein
MILPNKRKRRLLLEASVPVRQQAGLERRTYGHFMAKAAAYIAA